MSHTKKSLAHKKRVLEKQKAFLREMNERLDHQAGYSSEGEPLISTTKVINRKKRDLPGGR